jgi:hypothetical protein
LMRRPLPPSLSPSLLLLFACALPAPWCRAQASWVPVPAATLAAQRGGTGLQVTIAIERQVSINGEPVSQMTLQAVGAAASMSGGAARLLQTGAGNTFGASLVTTGATFVQNTLDGQAIRTDTRISADLNSGALLRDLNFYTSLREVLIAPASMR